MRYRFVTVVIIILLSMGFVSGCGVNESNQNHIEWEEHDPRAGRFMAAIVGGDYSAAAAELNDDLTLLIGVLELQSAWEDTVSKAGGFISFWSVTNIHDDDYDIYEVLSVHEYWGINSRIVFDEGGIAGLFFGLANNPVINAESGSDSIIIRIFTTNYAFLFYIGNIFGMLAVERVMRVFFGKRRTRFPVAAFTYFLSWAAFGVQAWYGQIFWVLALFYSSLFFLSFNYKSVISKRLIAVTGCFLLFQSCTIIYQFIRVIFIPGGLPVYFAAFAYIAASLLMYGAMFLISRLCKNISKITDSLHKLWLPFLFFPIAYFLTFIFVHINYTATVMIQQFTVFFGTTLIFFFFYDTVSKTIESNIQSALLSQEKEYYYSQCQLMQESAEQVKSLRHDMKAHLAALRDFSAGNKEAEEYINRLLSGINNSEIYSDTGNIGFDSVINYKLKNVLEDGIKLDIKIFIPPALNVEVADIVTILGNLLDNALNAVVKTEDKMIRLNVSFDKGALFINIENTFDGAVKYAEDKKTIITLKDGGAHGHGLKNIRKSVEKYNGHMEINHDKNIFSVGIMLYVN